MDPALYKIETFTPHLGTEFDLIVQQACIPLRLIEVCPGPSSPKVLQFALTFQGPPTPALPQHVYELRHGILGDMTLFLVPIGQNDAGIVYEAVFNRFVQPQPAPTA